MRVVLAFLEFLEGKHGIHANPFNYTLLLNNPPALCMATTPCDLIPGQALRGTKRGGLGPVLASAAHLARRAWLVSALGLPSFPGPIGFPPRGLGCLIATND